MEVFSSSDGQKTSLGLAVKSRPALYFWLESMRMDVSQSVQETWALETTKYSHPLQCHFP